MQTGAVTGYIDVAQLVLYAFWIFFFALIYYLRREDKREGYPLDAGHVGAGGRAKLQGFPAMPGPKTFLLDHGGSIVVPDPSKDTSPLAAQPVGAWSGAPLEPTGNAMLDGVGPAARTPRANMPDLTMEGLPMIVPLRFAPDFFISKHDTDPRGFAVLGADDEVGGLVNDLWVDRAEPQVRYIEIAPASDPERTVLVPFTLVRVDNYRRCVKVHSILGRQFAFAPRTEHTDRVTRNEEERICTYYGGGTLYAEPSRLGPWL